MVNKWIEASQLPEGEKVYLIKDRFGYRTIEPWKNEDGKINWFNFIFGGKRGLVQLIIIMIITSIIYLGVSELLNNYEIIATNPCNFCPTNVAPNQQIISINYSSGLKNFIDSFNNG